MSISDWLIKAGAKGTSLSLLRKEFKNFNQKSKKQAESV
jgi:hypothetical protein